MNKFKSCSKCYHRNLSYAQECEKCGADISSAPVTEVPSRNIAQNQGNDIFKILSLSISIVNIFLLNFSIFLL